MASNSSADAREGALVSHDAVATMSVILLSFAIICNEQRRR